MDRAFVPLSEDMMKCSYLAGDTLEEKLVSAGALFSPDYERKLRICLAEEEADRSALDNGGGPR